MLSPPAADCDIQPGDTVAVWGCGAVGQFAMISAYMMGAERVIAIDRFRNACRWQQRKAEVINYEEVDAGEALKEMTGMVPMPALMQSAEAHGVV